MRRPNDAASDLPFAVLVLVLLASILAGVAEIALVYLGDR